MGERRGTGGDAGHRTQDAGHRDRITRKHVAIPTPVTRRSTSDIQCVRILDVSRVPTSAGRADVHETRDLEELKEAVIRVLGLEADGAGAGCQQDSAGVQNTRMACHCPSPPFPHGSSFPTREAAGRRLANPNLPDVVVCLRGPDPGKDDKVSSMNRVSADLTILTTSYGPTTQTRPAQPGQTLTRGTPRSSREKTTRAWMRTL